MIRFAYTLILVVLVALFAAATAKADTKYLLTVYSGTVITHREVFPSLIACVNAGDDWKLEKYTCKPIRGI